MTYKATTKSICKIKSITPHQSPKPNLIMAIADARTQAYIGIFRNQHGAGGISVFQGLDRYQSGQGIGDFFRGLLRRVIPVALGAGKAALSAFAGAHDQGSSLKDSLKAVIRPAIQAAAAGSMEQISKAQQEREEKAAIQETINDVKKAQEGPSQKGTGRRRRKRVYKVKSHKRRKTISYNF